MKIFYVSETTNKSLTAEKYNELLERESKEYGITIEEAMANETDYVPYEIDLDIGQELTLDELDEKMTGFLNGINQRTTFDNRSFTDVISRNLISYQVTSYDYIKVRFEVTKECGANPSNSLVKITEIELS